MYGLCCVDMLNYEAEVKKLCGQDDACRRTSAMSDIHIIHEHIILYLVS